MWAVTQRTRRGFPTPEDDTGAPNFNVPVPSPTNNLYIFDNSALLPGNVPLRHSDIDYGFRPSSYWEPPTAVLDAVLRNVKGTERRATIRDYFRQGRLDELLPELTCDQLGQRARERLGRIHPSFMGGEYL